MLFRSGSCCGVLRARRRDDIYAMRVAPASEAVSPPKRTRRRLHVREGVRACAGVCIATEDVGSRLPSAAAGSPRALKCARLAKLRPPAASRPSSHPGLHRRSLPQIALAHRVRRTVYAALLPPAHVARSSSPVRPSACPVSRPRAPPLGLAHRTRVRVRSTMARRRRKVRTLDVDDIIIRSVRGHALSRFSPISSPPFLIWPPLLRHSS